MKLWKKFRYIYLATSVVVVISVFFLANHLFRQDQEQGTTQPLSFDRHSLPRVVLPTLTPEVAEDVSPSPMQSSEASIIPVPTTLDTPIPTTLYTTTPIPSVAPPPVQREERDSLSFTLDEKLMLYLINQERQLHGRMDFVLDQSLTEVARLKSLDMIEQNYFSHVSPRYGSPFDMLKQFNIDYQLAGENLSCHAGVEQAHEALMNSPGHRANLLDESYTYIGIGIIDGGPCGKMVTQLFLEK